MRKLVIFLLISLALFPLVSSLDCRPYYPMQAQDAFASDTLGNYRPVLVIDQNKSTNWYGNINTSYPKWVAVDLGIERCINKAALIAFIRDVPIHFNLEYSSDGLAWKSLLENQTLNEGGKINVYSFPVVSARYIRVVENSGERNYGSLSELALSSAAILDKNARNRVFLGAFDSSMARLVPDLPVEALENPYNLLEIKNTSDVPLAFTNLANKDHTFTITCNYHNPTISDKNPKSILGKFLSRIVSWYSRTQIIGHVTSDDGYNGYGCQGFDCWPEPPIETPNETIINDTIPDLGFYSCKYELPFQAKSAKASDTSSGFSAALAIDQNQSSTWYGNPSINYPKWIYADLGKISCISKTQLVVPTQDLAESITIEVSNDSQNWREIKPVYSLDQKSEIIDFNDTQARYVRVNLHSGERNYGALSELIVIGEAPSSSSQPVAQIIQNGTIIQGRGDIIIITQDLSGQPIQNVPVSLITAKGQKPVVQRTGQQGSVTYQSALTSGTKVAIKCPVN